MSDAHRAQVAADRTEPPYRDDPLPRRALPEPDDVESDRPAVAESGPVDEHPAEPAPMSQPDSGDMAQDGTDPDEEPQPAGAPVDAVDAPSPELDDETADEAAPDEAQPLPPTAAERSRPTRPPIVEAHAAIVEHTRPGRIQVASERVWTGAIVLGIVGILTALVTHGHAVDELAAKAHPGDPEQVRRAAANILHFTMIGIVAAGLLPEAILATFLGGRRVFIRVVLTALALGAAVILPLALEVLGPSGWRGTVIQVCIVGHAALALIASVLMWLPKGRRVKKK